MCKFIFEVSLIIQGDNINYIPCLFQFNINFWLGLETSGYLLRLMLNSESETFLTDAINDCVFKNEYQ